MRKQQQQQQQQYIGVAVTDNPYRSTTVPLSFRNSGIPDNGSFSSSYSKKKQILAAGCATLGCVVNGTMIGYSATAIPSLLNTNGTNLWNESMFMTQQEVSWMTSLLSLGCFFGSLMAGYVMDKIGRQKTLLFLTSSSFVLGYLFIFMAPFLEFIYIGRFLCGFGLGLELSVATVYIVEISSSDMRGLLGSFVQFMGSIGVLFSYTIGGFVKSYYTMALLNSLFTLPFILGLLMIPESPHWLLSKGREYQASLSLEWLRGRHNEAEIDAEIERIKLHIRAKKGLSRSSLQTLKQSMIPFCLSLGMMFFLSFSGFNLFIYYTVPIFQMTGSSLRPNLASVLVGLILLLSSIVSFLISSKVRRKIMMGGSMIGMALGHSILGVISLFHQRMKGDNYSGALGETPINYLRNDTNVSFSTFGSLNESLGEGTGIIPVLVILFIVFIGNVGYGTLIWFVSGEILPPKSRSIANSYLIGSAFLCGFIVTKTFVDLLESLQESGAFFLYSFICVLGALFSIFFVPETKGKTSQEIHNILYPREKQKQGISFDPIDDNNKESLT